jgi:hypothetical protein
LTTKLPTSVLTPPAFAGPSTPPCADPRTEPWKIRVAPWLKLRQRAGQIEGAAPRFVTAHLDSEASALADTEMTASARLYA